MYQSIKYMINVLTVTYIQYFCFHEGSFASVKCARIDFRNPTNRNKPLKITLGWSTPCLHSLRNMAVKQTAYEVSKTNLPFDRLNIAQCVSLR